MALAQNRFIAPVWAKLRTTVGVRFTRFVGVALAALATSEILLSICNGVFHMTATPAALISTFSGAAVSYVLSRWAWERKGRPDVLRETLPFWVISAVVWVILLLATKLGYHLATWMGLHGWKHVLVVDAVYFLANIVTFLVRFVIFHYILFTDRTTAARAAATGPDAVPPGTREAPRPAEAPHTAARAATAEAEAATGTGTAKSATSAKSAKSAAKPDNAKQAAPAAKRSTTPQATPAD